MNFYFYSTILLFVLLFIFLIIKIFFSRNDSNNTSKNNDASNISKKILELQRIVNEKPDDYYSLLELAMLEDKIGDEINALNRYEKLIKDGYFDSNCKEAFNIFSRLYDKYIKENNRAEILRYATQLLQLDPSNVEYEIKIATILGIEGQHLLASQYFAKLLYSRTDFNIEQLKVAIFTLYKVKDFKKVALFLEELYKKLYKSKDSGSKSDINNVAKSLISVYLISKDYSSAKSFIENLLLEKGLNSNYKLLLDRLLLFVLYKLNNNNNFINFYNLLLKMYNIEKSPTLAFDYGFYSYFLNKITDAIEYFKLVLSLDSENFSKYDVSTIIKYLSEISLASIENDYNYERYIDKDYISHWENVLELWESSFLSFNYLDSIIKVDKTINSIDSKLFKDLSLGLNSDTVSNKSSNINYSKLEAIYSMSIDEFKSLTINIINKLGYVIIDDYISTKKESFKDEFNYLTYYKKGNKKDTTLISFKRWDKVKIGELVVRDFLILIRECKAKNGILLIPTELSNSAKSYVRHNDDITVYSKDQFNNLLKDL